MGRTLLLTALTLGLHASSAAAQGASERFDLVVYGGTAGGVVTAIAAAREGATVALLEPRQHLGGMVSGGLGWTDFGKKDVIGGYALEFYERAGKKYGVPIQWYLEPHVAEAVLREWVAEAGVRVFFGHRLVEKAGVVKDGTRVTAIRLENGSDVSRQRLCRRHVRGRPDGAGRRQLHVRP